MFCLGVVFIVFILPILKGISELILSSFEVLKSKMNVSIYYDDQIISDCQDAPKKRIGFQNDVENNKEVDEE